MINSGTILLVDEDEDDVEIIKNIVAELYDKHVIITFSALSEAFDHMKKVEEKPFLIICDTNWRNKNQQKFKKLIAALPALKIKSVPFIFYSATIQDEKVQEAFSDLNIQGYFQKGSDYIEMKKDITAIINYWERSVTPVNQENKN